MPRIYDGLCLPKNHEIASTSGEITLRKDEDFDILCFEIN